MIDNYLLEELVIFAKERTLAKTAAQLNVTQPTVTRGMQKLEDELGVKLFDRQPNRITLTETGELAAKKASQLLQNQQEFIQQLRNFAAHQQVVKIASTAPGPLLILNHYQKDLPFPVELAEDWLSPDQIQSALHNNEFSLVISNQEIQTDQIESRFVGTESLFVNIDKFTYLANSRKVNFNDLAGLSFVVINNIGPWKKVIQDNIPDAKFFYQEGRTALQEITRYSNFPYFSTDITQDLQSAKTADSDRVTLKITDEAATMTFYVNYLKDQKESLSPLIKKMGQIWERK